MAAGTIEVYQNADQSIRLHFSGPKPDGSPGTDVDLTGKKVTLYVSRELNQPFLFVPIEVTSHADALHGVTYVPLTADMTNKAPRGYRYELWLDNTPSDMGTFVIKDTLGGSA